MASTTTSVMPRSWTSRWVKTERPTSSTNSATGSQQSRGTSRTRSDQIRPDQTRPECDTGDGSPDRVDLPGGSRAGDWMGEGRSKRAEGAISLSSGTYGPYRLIVNWLFKFVLISTELHRPHTESRRHRRMRGRACQTAPHCAALTSGQVGRRVWSESGVFGRWSVTWAD